jgi:hypothetical protein
MSGGSRSPPDVDAAENAAKLPCIDEHTLTIRVDDPMRTWRALGDVLARSHVPGFGRSHVPRFMRVDPGQRSGDPLHRGSTLPGFTVVRAEPGRELALQGRHRFASYALIFRLAADEHHTTLSAETRAAFPGFGGRVYRGLVIGTRGHVLVVRGLLRAIRSRAEQR